MNFKLQLRKVSAFIGIIRPINFLITFFSIVVAGIICSTNYNYHFKIILLAGFSGSLAASAGNVINDIFDIGIDRINRPDRALPSGIINQKEAFYYYIFLNLAGAITAALINTVSFIIVLFSICVMFVYSYKLKKIPLAGNFTVAFMTGLAFIFGGTAAGNINAAFIPAIFAFLINLIREIVKDIEDIEGDMINNVFSYPAKYGTKAAIRLIILLSVVLLLFTFIPFILRIYHIEYFVIVMLTVNTGLFLFIIRLKGNITRTVISRGSFLLKLYMIFGLIAIYFGNS